MRIAEYAPGHPYHSPCCGQPMTQSEPHDGAALLHCVLCARVWTTRTPVDSDKPRRGAFAK